MEITAYLERINYKKSINPDIETLYGLHLAHMLAVPFENLDIGLKHKIQITEQALYEKIVIDKRGGFCYELNGMFAWLLRQIGFDVTYLNARVYKEGGLGINFGHLTLLVKIPAQPGRWLVDVGFGDSFTEPLQFDERDEQIQGLRAYRLEQISDGYVMWQKSYAGKWERKYFFDLQACNFPEDYEAGCQYHQTSSKSSFTRGSIISKATPNGRISLEEGKLISTVNGVRTEKPLADRDEYQILLKQHFDVEI